MACGDWDSPAPKRETNMSTPTWWNVTHPELPVRVVVAARTEEEARALAWTRWYRRAPRNELEALMRAACSAENSGVPADSESSA